MPSNVTRSSSWKSSSEALVYLIDPKLNLLSAAIRADSPDDYRSRFLDAEKMGRTWWMNGKLWVGIICSGVFLVLVFRNVQWLELAAVLHTVNWAILLFAAALYALSLVVRGFCWQALLAHLGSVTKGEAVIYANIGYMANNLLPLRAGEVIRAALLGDKRCFSKSAVLATVVLERLLDVLILGALAIILMATIAFPSTTKRGIVITTVICGLSLLAIWAANRARTDSPGKWLPGLLRWRLARAVVGPGQSFAKGLAAMHSIKQAGVAGLYSLLGWALVCGSIYLMMLASQLRLPWYAALLVMVVVNLGSAIPSSPGSIGVVHFLAVVAVSPWSIDREVAVAFSIVFHAMSFAVTILLGGACLWRAGIGIGRVNKASLAAAP
jgi:uncharacterized protein (TIRG00374 family)